MGSLAVAFSYLLMAWGAIRTMRENQRRGVRVDWKRALIVAGCSILLAAIAGGVMVGAIMLGWPIAGVILFFAVFLAGIVGMAVAANRIWPPAASQPQEMIVDDRRDEQARQQKDDGAQ